MPFCGRSPGDEGSARELPLPDYDHLPLGSLAHRVRTLDADALGTLLAYERAHGDRLPVTELMRAPEVPRETNQTTVAPTINPPSHGDPTNPAQPR